MDAFYSTREKYIGKIATLIQLAPLKAYQYYKKDSGWQAGKVFSKDFIIPIPITFLGFKYEKFTPKFNFIKRWWRKIYK